MITTNIPNLSSTSAIKAKVDFYNESTLAETCTCADFLETLEVAREGDNSKFFGFGVCHKLSANLIDLERRLQVTKNNTVKVGLGDGTTWDNPYPTFYITELARNEKTNNISCTAYDTLYQANFISVSELNLTGSFNLLELAHYCAYKLGLLHVTCEGPYRADLFNTVYFEAPLNLNGDEPLRVLLDAIAEFTQTVYFIKNFNDQDVLVFKALNKTGDPVLTIDRDMYFELTTLTPKILTGLGHATELGDNLITADTSGIVQIMRDNPLYEMNPNTATLLDEAAARMTGFTIHQFDCEWGGNHLLEIGDRVAFVTEDNDTIFTYIINDVLEYKGFVNELTAWEYTQEDSTAGNPTNIGDRINQTVAKVDKVNKEITLLVSDVEDTKSELSTLRLTSDEIAASVSSLETTTLTNVESLTYDVETLAKEVSLKVSSDNIAFVVQQTLSEGVDRVVTSAKEYTFDDTGLNISTPDSEISTQITEDGMKIYKNTAEVLTADNKGVKATDLHAVTYLLIGENSRLEDKGGNRTACFWIGRAGG